jgi:hypothetical protein
VFLLALICVFAAVPNPVLRADSFFYSYVVLAKLEEMNVRLISGYRLSSVEEF